MNWTKAQKDRAIALGAIALFMLLVALKMAFGIHLPLTG